MVNHALNSTWTHSTNAILLIIRRLHFNFAIIDAYFT